MNIYILLIISLILILVGNAFYIAFKKYEEDDDFVRGIGTFSIVELLLGFLVSISDIGGKYIEYSLVYGETR